MTQHRQPFADLAQDGAIWPFARKLCDLNSTMAANLISIGHKSRAAAVEIIRGNEKPPSEFVQAMMQFGRDNEPKVRHMFEQTFPAKNVRTTGLWIKRFGGMLVGASPDALVDDDALLEIKCSVRNPDGSFKETVRAVPMYDIPQLLIQMAVTGRHHVYYARWNGNDAVAVFDVAYDEKLTFKILATCKQIIDRFAHNTDKVPNVKSLEKGVWMHDFIQFSRNNIKEVGVITTG